MVKQYHALKVNLSDFDLYILRVIEMLKADFPEYSTKLKKIEQDLKENDSFTCYICFDEEQTKLYRNCLTCKCVACKDCWSKLKQCPLCKQTIKWKNIL